MNSILWTSAIVVWLFFGVLTILKTTKRWPLRSGGFWSGFRFGYARAFVMLFWPGVLAAETMEIESQRAPSIRRRGRPQQRPPAHTPSLEGLHHSCGGTFALVVEPTEIAIRGITVRVPQEFFRCSKCNAERLTLEQMDAARHLAAEQLRTRKED